MAAHKGHSRANASLFIGIVIAAAGAMAFALINGSAPLTAGLYLPDWIDWVRIAPSMSGLLALGLVGLLVGVVGTIVSLMAPARKKPVRRAEAIASASVAEIAPDILQKPAPAAPAVPQLVADNTRKASLRFETPIAAAPPIMPEPAPEVAAPAEPQPSAEIIPFRAEPALAEAPEAAPESVEAVETVEVAVASADPIAAALLHDGPEARTAPDAASDINAVIHSAMRFIDRPDPASVTSVEEVHAVRAEETHSDAPPRVVKPELTLEEPVRSTAEYKALSEALSLTDDGTLLDSVVLEAAPESLPPEPVPVIEPVAGIVSEPVAETLSGTLAEPVAMAEADPEIPADPQAEIGRALTAALAHWPDATRDIAEGELRVRLGQLYHDSALQSREAFARITSGDLNGGAAVIAQEAQAFANARLPEKAAELWRVYGALHMGRDDTAAMHAYEQVSALDTADGNIHMYLVHRYRMAEDKAKLLPVLGRALGVVGDRDTRLDLLTQYADLTQAGGHLNHTAQALEELSRIRGELSAEDPDNLQKRSALAIALAKQAQVRELMGEGPKAAPLYQHAHRVFAELSARVPDHAGLKAMAENARRDAERLSA
ncbi:hypothetical protein [Asticcacaulis sp. AND118]|uniref:hypothetical protein n=1 Tax=Asticcacaulis sp. AND118 TaxID=2840468 RepID=UPI001CFFB03A|nr:hypothetical protein [Asticcacaulis sp. AND118]UDF02843.1 hypothetical protein LH365_10425 [Asticcacaulis sp. AND118]